MFSEFDRDFTSELDFTSCHDHDLDDEEYERRDTSYEALAYKHYAWRIIAHAHLDRTWVCASCACGTAYVTVEKLAQESVMDCATW